MFKTLNLWRQKFPKQELSQENYIPYFGDGDNFTLKWAEVISKSPSGASCLSTLGDFMEGSGFNNADLENLPVNDKGETFFQIHQKTVKEFAQNEGFYWLFRYNALGQITEWEVLPFENCRLGRPDDNGYIGKVFYNPYFGTSQFSSSDSKSTKIYDIFNPAVVKEQYLEQKNTYKGQVFFYGTSSTVSRFYPIHEAYSSVQWMKIESGVADYHEDTIDNGFLNEFILLMKGNPNAPSQNPEYTSSDPDKVVTVAEEFDQVVGQNFMGKGKHANLMIQWIDNNDEKPEILSIPSKANGDLFVTLDNQATKKITIAWKVPGILANIQEGVSLGGDANQIRVAVQLMQQRVTKKQRILTDNYSKILKLFPKPYTDQIEIVSYNPYPELEEPGDKTWNALTQDERREWVQDNTEIDLKLEEAPQIQPEAPTAKFNAAVPIAFPDNVRNKIKKTIEYVDKMQMKCGGKGGRQVSDAILNNENLGLKNLKRIYSYLKKRPEYANSPYSDGCHIVEYNAWGGKDMEIFLESKLKELEEWLN